MEGGEENKKGRRGLGRKAQEKESLTHTASKYTIYWKKSASCFRSHKFKKLISLQVQIFSLLEEFHCQHKHLFLRTVIM